MPQITRSIFALSFVVAALALPSPNHPTALLLGRQAPPADAPVYPVYADPPAAEGPWVGCEFGDDECGCTNAVTGLEHYCGFIHPSWETPQHHRGRKLLEEDGDESADGGTITTDDGPFPEPTYEADAASRIQGSDRRLTRRENDPAVRHPA